MDEAGPSVFQGNDDFFPFISTNQKKKKKNWCCGSRVEWSDRKESALASCLPLEPQGDCCNILGAPLQDVMVVEFSYE